MRNLLNVHNRHQNDVNDNFEHTLHIVLVFLLSTLEK